MEQIPSWEGTKHSSTREILCFLWNPKVHYHIHKILSLISIESHMHPFHTFPPDFPKIHSNVIFLSKPTSSKWSLAFRFFDQNCICFSYLSHACYMLGHLILFHLIILIILGEAQKLWSSPLHSLLQAFTISSHVGPNILLSTLLSNPQSMLFS